MRLTVDLLIDEGRLPAIIVTSGIQRMRRIPRLPREGYRPCRDAGAPVDVGGAAPISRTTLAAARALVCPSALASDRSSLNPLRQCRPELAVDHQRPYCLLLPVLDLEWNRKALTDKDDHVALIRKIRVIIRGACVSTSAS